MAEEQTPTAEVIDTDADHFPTLEEAVTRLLQTTGERESNIRRLDLRFDAGGYGYYRVWVGRDEDHVVGSIGRDQTS